MDTGRYGIGGFEIWRLWVPPYRTISPLLRATRGGAQEVENATYKTDCDCVRVHFSSSYS